MKKIKTNTLYNEVTTQLLIIENKLGKWKSKPIFQKFSTKIAIELLGTFILTFLIIAPNSFSFSNAEIYGDVWSTIWQIPLLSTLWPALVIGLAVSLFFKISCNLNPAVTLFEWKMGAVDSKTLGFYTIAQFAGAIAASYTAWAIADSTEVLAAAHVVSESGEILVSGFELDSLHPKYTTFWPTGSNTIFETQGYSGSEIGYYLLTMVLEFIGVCALLYIIVKNSDKPSFTVRIVFLSWLLIRIMMPFHTFDLNPARAFGPALASYTQGGNPLALEFYWMFLVAQIAAAIYMGNKYRSEEQSKKSKDPRVRLNKLRNDFKL